MLSVQVSPHPKQRAFELVLFTGLVSAVASSWGNDMSSHSQKPLRILKVDPPVLDSTTPMCRVWNPKVDPSFGSAQGSLYSVLDGDIKLSSYILQRHQRRPHQLWMERWIESTPHHDPELHSPTQP